MAALSSEVIFKIERRACYVDGKRAMWHKWVDVTEAVPQIMLRGGYPAGTVRDTLALVEYEDGTMAKVRPERVTFADGGDFGELAFLPPPEERGHV